MTECEKDCLEEEDLLPASFQYYDEMSGRGQKAAKRLNLARLVGVTVAAIAGATDSVMDLPQLGSVSLLGFMAALGSDYLLLQREPEKTWYAAREAAETIKTLAWCYAVGGEHFPHHMRQDHADRRFIEKCAEIRSLVSDDILVSSTGGVVSEIKPTSLMIAVRTDWTFCRRREAYIAYRVRKEAAWYGQRAARNHKAAQKWKVFLVAAEIAALTLLSARMSGGTQAPKIDWAGIMAALVAAGSSWMHFKQYEFLTSAYSRAQEDLETQVERLAISNEDQWPHAVADAEAAISREHRLWKSTRGSVTT
ncbi:hypothetical protein J2W20_000084 [Sinomonas atrocyanea]|jgi:hypothetical protein|uniref:DUF4231 domain-containing protein n=1 Tax=Sinomonas atrocyanea TaxID=37927 RepID=UPI002786AAD4|nr:DUF4231 domain-containing protein [Sinomonas atrocyanea]MDQ0258209.1 hypothetical protein [Sinomonas atrocyanea]